MKTRNRIPIVGFDGTLTTTESSSNFSKCWFQAYGRVADLDLNGKLQSSSYKLAKYLLRVSVRRGRLACRLDDADVTKHTGLKRSSLYAARNELASKNILEIIDAKDTRGRVNRVYALLNPSTRERFPDGPYGLL